MSLQILDRYCEQAGFQFLYFEDDSPFYCYSIGRYFFRDDSREGWRGQLEWHRIADTLGG